MGQMVLYTHKYLPVPDAIKDLDLEGTDVFDDTKGVCVSTEFVRNVHPVCFLSTWMTNLEFMAADMLLKKKKGLVMY